MDEIEFKVRGAMTDRELLEYIALTLDSVERRLSDVESDVKTLTEFTNGVVDAVDAAKSSGGMGGMMANMLPSLPKMVRK